MSLRRVAASCALVLAGTLTATADETTGRYMLGPQDHLKIRVYDLRRNTGEAYSWAALNGEFTVAADGTVSMPLIGSIRAAGTTPADLADAIGNSLKQAADLAEKPAASVEVATYRPFYITGAVQHPGKYEYQPGLTVLQAVSTAQGLMRGEDTRGLQRDAVTSRGETRTLAAERIALTAKQARLEAEIAGADTINFGEELKGSVDKARADQAMRAEQLLFETRRNAIKAETAAIEQSIGSFKNEMSTLDSKSKTLDRQLELSRGELSMVNDLVTRGLTIGSRKLAAEQNQASFESSRLDVQIAVLRAQQSLTRAERDIIDLKARFRRDALAEAAETNQKLAQNDEKMRTAERLTVNAESQLLGSTDDGTESLVPRYEITRKEGVSPQTWPATEDMTVEPGDVVRVTLVRKQAGKAAVPPQAPAQRRAPASGDSSRANPGAAESVQRSADSAKR
jgi:protein involved in polysaccharide export with SLBB domain